MKVDLQKSFPLPASRDVAWLFLQNIEAVAQCMPGAKITERIDDTHFKGTVNLRVGPVTMAFRGEVEVKAIDPATRTLHLVGRGTDITGTSGASMDLNARIEATGASSNLVGVSSVSMSGKAAAFGGRMMNSVADRVLNQFADNFALQVAALEAQQASASSAAPAVAAAPPMSQELNGLNLVWVIVKDWLRTLFSNKAA